MFRRGRTFGLVAGVTTLMSGLALGTGTPAVAGGLLVANGGFESGDFTGWSVAAPDPQVFVNCAGSAHSGACYAQLGPLQPDSLSQTIRTTKGRQYQVSFYRSGGDPGQGTAFLNLSAAPAESPASGTTLWSAAAGTNYNGYVHVVTTFTAQSRKTILTFNFQNDFSYYYLDDVLVTRV